MKVIANPLASVLKASLRGEGNMICLALNEVLLLCKAPVIEKLIRQACKMVEDGEADEIGECFIKVMFKALRTSTNGAERAAALLVWGMHANNMPELETVMSDIVYPMYLDPEDIRASVLE